MSSVFFGRFERHAHAEGLKGLTTHYCAGCGHGIIHKFLADAIAELGIQDRVVAVSPVGCAVFMYYYLDVGNTQAAHGRAPAVALGHKTANPEAVVVSYQGDGDLASIGLAEIMQAAQLGIPLTFVFVNNAIYGMTGGQMAPTTLPAQKTTTTPLGRGRLTGFPLKMAELIAQMDGPIYVERVALFDNKQRHRARRAIKKALRLQVENRGMTFVEVLSECPTHLHLTPLETERWVKEEMLPQYPLGVKKDLAGEPWFALKAAVYSPDAVVAAIGADRARAAPSGSGFPSHLDPEDVAVKFAGAGGDGTQTIAMLTTRVAIGEGFDATYIPSYGPESRGGTSYADVHIATREVLSPAAPDPHVLVAFNPQSLQKFAPRVRPGGVVLYDSSLIVEAPAAKPRIRVLGVPFTRIAADLGTRRVKNVVALGAFQAATRLFPEASFAAAIGEALRGQDSLPSINLRAFALGREAVAGRLP